MTENEKCENGYWYDANNDEELLKQRYNAKDLCLDLNQTHFSQLKKRDALIRKIFPAIGENVEIITPIQVDYGYNVKIGDGTFINHNAYLMDGAKITIGSHCFIGPNCGIYTAVHPLLAEERNRGYEKAKSITIEDDVWIGADVTILPGVTIGKGAVIGAKSNVTKSVPQGAVAAGNPCKVIRYLSGADSMLEEMENEEKQF